MINYDLEKRRFILSGVAIAIITVYLIRLFALQIASDDYRKRADFKYDEGFLCSTYERYKG